MNTKRKYPKDTIDRAMAMREAGQGLQEIANDLGMSKGSVEYYCRLYGVLHPKAELVPRQARGAAVVKRGNHVVRRFTEEEDRQILEMAAACKGVKEIGEALGRKHNSISARLQSLGLREEREELHAARMRAKATSARSAPSPHNEAPGA